MEAIIALTALLSLGAFVIGMFSPKTVKCNSRGKVALVYIGSFFGLMFINSSLSEKTKDTPSQMTTQETPMLTEEQASQISEQKEVEPSIGKPIQIGHFIYTINNVEFRKSVGNEFVSETADGIYMLVNLSIKNVSKETRTLEGSLFAVTDTDGIKYEYSVAASTALEMSGKKTLLMKECQPNITTKGILAFEVPQKGVFYLHLIGSFWGTETVRVLLK